MKSFIFIAKFTTVIAILISFQAWGGVTSTYPEEDVPRFIIERGEDGVFKPVGNDLGVDAMRNQLLSSDYQRLIVGLQTPIAAEEVISYGADGLDLYREAAEQAQQAFAISLSSLISVQELDHFSSIDGLPYVVVHGTPEVLDALITIESVKTINIETGGPALLNDSSTFIGAPSAHSSGFTGSGRAIAVIDTGVARNHPMLSGEVVSEACYSTASYSSIGSICQSGSHGSTSTNSGGPCDDDPGCGPGHGTHVAAIAAGKSVTPGGGVPSMKGVAYNADIISLMPLSRVDNNTTICGSGNSPCYRFFESDVASALSRVQSLKGSFNIPAVNMSLLLGTFSSQFSSSTCDSQWPVVRDAVSLLVNSGTAVIAASGNAGDSPSYRNKIGSPSCLSKVMSVGATAKNSNSYQSYSNASSKLDILSPGGTAARDLSSSDCRTAHLPPSQSFILPSGIWSAYYRPSCTSGYIRDSGTSMAAPHVSAAFALMDAKYPEASSMGIRDWLNDSGVNVSFSQGSSSYNKPRISISNALTAPTTPSSGPSNTTVTTAQCFGSNNVTWSSLTGATEHHVQGSSNPSFSSKADYYRGPLTSAFINVTQTTHIRVRACNMVSCGPWSVSPVQAQYFPYCL